MAWLRRAALLGIVLLSCLSCVSQAGKILVFTTPLTKSHAMNLKKIAEELSEERGHHITVRHQREAHVAMKYRTVTGCPIRSHANSAITEALR